MAKKATAKKAKVAVRDMKPKRRVKGGATNKESSSGGVLTLARAKKWDWE